MRKIGMLVCTIILMMCIVPLTAYALPAESYEVWILDTQVTSENKDDILGDGSAWYDPETKTLTIKDLHLHGQRLYQDGFYHAIFAVKDLNLCVLGENILTVENKRVDSFSIGVESRGNLTIEGTGYLEAYGDIAELRSFGIRSGGDLTIRDRVTVKAVGNMGAHEAGIMAMNEIRIQENADVTSIGIGSYPYPPDTDPLWRTRSSGIENGEALIIEGGRLVACGHTSALFNPTGSKEHLDLSNCKDTCEVIVNTDADNGLRGIGSEKWNGTDQLGGNQCVLNGPQYEYVAITANTPALPVITREPSAVTASVGKAATVSVKARNAESYEWHFMDPGSTDYPESLVKANARIIGQGTSSLTVIPNENWFSGWMGGTVSVYCTITNQDGSVKTQPVSIQVKSAAEEHYVLPFSDVKPGDWFCQDVAFANRMGLINGKTASEYKPADNMTIAEAIKLASCMHQLDNTGYVTLKNGSPSWYDSYVQYAKEHGIPWQYPDYNAMVSREEYVHIFFHALSPSAYTVKNDVAALPDVPQEHKYFDEILTFYKAGILTGNDSRGTFLPKSSIKRSEVAAILTRMMDDTARKTFTLNE